MIVMPKKQRKHNYISSEAIQWLNIHFPSDSNYQGRVFIGQRKGEDAGIYNLTRCNINELAGFMPRMHISQNLDYYVMANSVSGVSRKTDDVFALHNIVIDVDCHGEDVGTTPTELSASFVWLCQRDLWRDGSMPVPNSIVYTGRGVQFWWAIDAISVKLHWIYKRIQEWMMDKLQEIVDENSMRLNGLSIDRGASKKIAGWFRLPCTYNTQAGRWGMLQIERTQRYSHQELFDLIPEGYQSPYKEKEPKREFSNSQSFIPLEDMDCDVMRDGSSRMALRVHQLIKLRALRKARLQDEMRDRFCFSVYCSLLADYSEAEAWERLCLFNKGFTEPLGERNLAQMMSSAEVKMYKLKNDTLIELLEISEEEQAIIGLFPTGTKKAERKASNFTRDLLRRTRKEDRDYRIITMFTDGESKAEIARILGISRPTVIKVLAEYESALEAKNEANTEESALAIAVGAEEFSTSKEVSKNGAYIYVFYGDASAGTPVSPALNYPIKGDSPPKDGS